MRQFWEFKNAANDPQSAELLLYGNISESSWWGDDITPRQFNSDLNALGNVKNILVRINSNGGDVFAAHAICNSLRLHSAAITVRVDGLAASAATIIMLAADEVVMPENAMVMIHNPWTYAMGDEHDLRKIADDLAKIKESIMALYESRTGMKQTELTELMNSTTWMTAADAVTAGFADRVERNVKVRNTYQNGIFNINGLQVDVSHMKFVPVALLMSASEEISPPDDGVENNTAPAADAEQNNLEGDHDMSDTSKTDQPNEPVAAPTADPQNKSAAEIASQERARVLAIMDLARPGAEEIIKAAIDNGDSPEATSYKILTSEGVQNAAALAVRKADAQSASVTGQPIEGAAEAAVESRIDKMAKVANKHLSFVRGGGVR